MNKFYTVLKFSFPAIVAFGLLNFQASAQSGVSINDAGTAPDADAILDISSTTKGVLLPRVANHTSLTPDNGSDFGLTVYNTTTTSYWFWDGATWQEIPSVSSLTSNTLDEAYDEGGAGAGRIINADAGNVEIQGAGNLTVASSLGVGTTTPSEKLEVQFTGRGGILVDGDGTNDAFVQIENTGGSHYIFDDSSDGHKLKIESATNKDLVFNTSGANERMAILSDGRVRVNNLADANNAVVFTNATGIMGKIPFTGSATDILLGDGTFGSAASFSDHDWYSALSTNQATGIGDWIYTNGHVGIGTGPTTNPSAPLHVVASGAGNPSANSILANNPNNVGGQDAIVTARVAGPSAGDPFFSLDIAGEFGWSLGIDNSDANRFKIAPSWSNLSAGTALTIQTDAKVGVGTTTPNDRLTVTGTNTDTYPALGLRSGNNNTGFNDGAQIAFGYNGSSTYQHFIQTRHNSTSAQNAIDFYVSNGTQNNTLTSGSTHVMTMESGNVGIGTTAPASVLHVNTTQTGNVSKLHNSSLGNGSLVGHEFGKNNNTNNMAEFRYNHISDGNSGNWINLGLWGNANTLNVVGTGNVGIGTTSPQHQLSVGTNTADGQPVSIRGYSNSPTNWKGGGAFGFSSAAVIMGELNGVAQLGGHNGNLTAWANLAINSGGGNVGVGTNAPAQKFHVVGTTRISTLAGGGNVQANANGDLVISNNIPANDADYIWNQNSSAQGANWRISGQGEANTLVANANGNWYLRGGDDHELRDVNIANMMGVWGRQNADRAGIQLGSDGSYIFGDNGNIGVGTTGPVYKLDVAGTGRTTSSFYANTEIYINNWVRHSDNDGTYWSNNNWHIYPQDGADMNMRTGSGNGGIRGTISDATARGYVHWTTGNEIGFLDNVRSWQLRSYNGGGELYDIWYGNDFRPYIIYDRNNTGYYWNGDGTSRMYYGDFNYLHTQVNDSWFPYTGNNWNYFRGNTYAFNAPWLDENNTGYYIDPSGSSRFYNINTLPGFDGYFPPNNAIRMTPNFHFNAADNYAFIVNWDQGTTGAVQTFRVGNGAGADVFYVYADGQTYTTNWFRPLGSTGLYFQSYGGGWHMTDATWIRSYNSKNVYVNTTMRADGGVESGGGSVRMRGSQPGMYAGASGYNFNLQGVILESGYDESGGFQANGNNANIWSPGDADLVRFYDEDGMVLRSYINGFSGAYTQASDINKKQNIEPITGALDKLKAIGGYTYEFKLNPDEIAKGNLPVLTAGVIAQEVREVIPEIVDDHGEDGIYMNYDGLTPYIIEAVKEQQEQIDEISSRTVNISDFGIEQTNRTELFVSFSDEFIQKNASGGNPVVTVTPVGSMININVSETSNQGFTVLVDNASGNSVTFNWIAMAKTSLVTYDKMDKTAEAAKRASIESSREQQRINLERHTAESSAKIQQLIEAEAKKMALPADFDRPENSGSHLDAGIEDPNELIEKHNQKLAKEPSGPAPATESPAEHIAPDGNYKPASPVAPEKGGFEDPSPLNRDRK